MAYRMETAAAVAVVIVQLSGGGGEFAPVPARGAGGGPAEIPPRRPGRPTDAAAVAVFVAFARILYSFRETSFLHLLVSAATAGSGAGTSRTPRRSQQTMSPL